MFAVNKKGNVALGLLAVLIVIILVYGVYNFAKSDCRSNSSCSDDEYCGSDFECHKFPVIEKTIIANENTYNFKSGALILATALIVAAIILRKGRKNNGGREDQGDFDNLYSQTNDIHQQEYLKPLYKEQDNIPSNKRHNKRY